MLFRSLQIKEEAITAFNLGVLDLNARAKVEQMFWATCAKLLKIVRDLDYVPDELEGLERQLSDTYYCNFSLFQSMPDHWAVKQLFPTIPIHRLNQQPQRRGIIADLTCDSDGKIDRFVGERAPRPSLQLHPFHDGEPYIIGIFLTGAYQEILGDLHNLFGDTNAVHVQLDDKGAVVIDALIRGDTVREVLDYVQFRSTTLAEQFRRDVEIAVREGRIGYEESGLLLRFYEDGLNGYTYLEQ